MTLRTLNYGNYGIFLIVGNAGFISSTVVLLKGSDDKDLETSSWTLVLDSRETAGFYAQKT